MKTVEFDSTPFKSLVLRSLGEHLEDMEKKSLPPEGK